jgi:hypothetical protein
MYVCVQNFLLKEAVQKRLGRAIRSEAELNRVQNQISWIDISNYIKSNGGSYSFGAATVKKQYVKRYCSGRDAQ